MTIQPESPNESFRLNELCLLADLPLRTVRYYIQQGLVDRPEGETRAARYSRKHLDQLLLIKKWTAAGLSLDRIRELLAGEQTDVPERSSRRGTVEVVSRLNIADGVELVIEPNRAGLTPEQLRELSRGVMALYDAISAQKTNLPI